MASMIISEQENMQEGMGEYTEEKTTSKEVTDSVESDRSHQRITNKVFILSDAVSLPNCFLFNIILILFIHSA